MSDVAFGTLVNFSRHSVDVFPLISCLMGSLFFFFFCCCCCNPDCLGSIFSHLIHLPFRFLLFLCFPTFPILPERSKGDLTPCHPRSTQPTSIWMFAPLWQVREKGRNSIGSSFHIQHPAGLSDSDWCVIPPSPHFLTRLNHTFSFPVGSCTPFHAASLSHFPLTA